ncbi:NADPH:quinone reductase [Roseovarius pacificus]|uniref:NADPH:quinone reductase n=1 Tax=Roseovarius pacificus TaxID=337701 RepID=A0A1M6Y9E1_9RHOB|nr:NADPH:quinone oxidoreductase family protein [Roseovarius pacificus]GGO51156.1 NADPH:quinone oxidoreductase [Roseovarius pacificus]SHL14871.1 NADPH:quinone reductase [Roseovarius pacificus]
MKAVLVREFGPVDTARVEDLPEPTPGPGEVVVDLRAAEVNFPDILVMEGKYQVKPPLPFSPGKAGAGVISSIGQDVSGLEVGDHVAIQAEYGTYAGQIAITADNCHPMPDDMPFEVGAALGLVYQTAHFALIERAAMKPGDTVLVLGASGGVGSAAVQLARAMGAGVVIGGVKGARNAELARAAGCDETVDLGMDNLRDGLRDKVRMATDGHGADVVIDPVGGAVTEAALRAMAWRGRLVVVGFAAGEIPTIKANYLLVKNIAVSGLQWSDYRERDPAWVHRVQQDIFDLWSQGKLSPQIADTLPLDQFSDALQRLQEGRAHGKIILTP